MQLRPARTIVTSALLSLLILSVGLVVPLVVPLSAVARGLLSSHSDHVARVAGGRGGGGTSVNPNGCKLRNKNVTRLPLKTTRRLHQPFVEYRGHLASPDGKTKLGWDVLIDRCGATAKVAIASGGIPGFICPAGGGFYGYNSALIDFLGHELAIHSGRFSASGLGVGIGDPDSYSLTGTVTGTVKIPKHGPGKGASTITGTLTDNTFCPSSPLTYKVTFVRTWSYV